MKYKAIIFDMDGTIILTEHMWRQATYDILTKRNVELTQELLEKLNFMMAGVGLLRGCTVLKELTAVKDSIEILAQEKNALVMGKIKEELKLIEGFIAFHQKMQVFSLKAGLATNADDEAFILIKETLQLHSYFGDHMYNVTHVVGKYKPDPALYLHASEKLGIPPNLCIAIEDSAHGVNAAKAAGMFCIGINTSQRLEQLQNADIIVNSYDEIDLKDLLGLKA